MKKEAAGRARMMNLKEVVEQYLGAAGSFGKPVGLAAFGLEPAETEGLFGALDEDYHISRFLHFSHADGDAYVISGDTATHVAVDPAIYSLF